MYETIVIGQILNTAGPFSGYSVNLNRIIELNSITGYRNTTTVFSSTTDSNGYVNFSGVSAGNYDVQIISGTYSYYMYNYVVKNAYPIPEGDSSFVEESRTYVRSLETMAPSGIMVNNAYRPQVALNQPIQTDVEAAYTLQAYSGVFYSTINEAAFVTSGTNEREYGDTYFRGNQNLKNVQTFIYQFP